MRAPRWAQQGYLGIGVRRALGANNTIPDPTFWWAANDAGSGAVDTTLTRGVGAATFTRATTATTIGPTGLIVSVASGVARSYYDPSGLYLGYLSEQASTNLVLQSENFGTTWTAEGTPTRSAAAKTCGSVSLDLIGDDSGAALEGYAQTVTFTGNAVKAVSLFVSGGTSTSSVVRIRDDNAPAERLVAVIAWSGGVPTPSMTTGTHLGTDTLGNGVYRLRFATTSITAANTHRLFVYPAATDVSGNVPVGNIYVGGVQAENNTFCTSYIPTTTATVTRNADVLTYPVAGNFTATAGSAYAEAQSIDVSASRGLMATTSDARLLYFNVSELQFFDGTNNTGNPTVTAGAVVKCASAWTGATARVALSGDIVSGTFTGGPLDTSADLGIGVAASGVIPLNGTIRNVRIWTRALADAQLRTLTA